MPPGLLRSRKIETQKRLLVIQLQLALVELNIHHFFQIQGNQNTDNGHHIRLFQISQLLTLHHILAEIYE